MAQVRTMLHAAFMWWYCNVSHRYDPAKHYLRGRVSNWHKEQK
mgnify:CR=1 FL=1